MTEPASIARAARSAGATQGEKGPWERYGWIMAAVWMVFLYFPVRALLDSPAGPGLRALGWAAIAGFAAAYLLGFVFGMRAGWRRPSRRVRLLFGIAVAAALLTAPALGWDALSFLPFLMAYASYGLGALAHWTMTAVGIALVLLDAALVLAQGGQPSWFLMGIVLMMAAVNTINTWLIDRSVTADELRMELATSEERESIARDVHDLVGHLLTVVKLKAELAERLVDRDPAAARAELAEISRLAGEAIAGVRGTVTGLRSQGLAEQLRASAAALGSAGIEVEVRGEPSALSPAQSLPASWILREATTNVLRHAQAGRVRIGIEPGTIVIEDDGAGVGRARAGNGLRGMAERAAAAGAVLGVEPGERGGTRVRLTW